MELVVNNGYIDLEAKSDCEVVLKAFYQDRNVSLMESINQVLRMTCEFFPSSLSSPFTNLVMELLTMLLNMGVAQVWVFVVLLFLLLY